MRLDELTGRSNLQSPLPNYEVDDEGELLLNEKYMPVVSDLKGLSNLALSVTHLSRGILKKALESYYGPLLIFEPSRYHFYCSSVEAKHGIQRTKGLQIALAVAIVSFIFKRK